jgi:hypothetical protein
LEKLEDTRLKLLGGQLIHAEHPEILNPKLRLQYDREIAKRIAYDNPDRPWLTLPKALEEVEQQLISATATERKVLIEHREYLTKRLNDALAIL